MSERDGRALHDWHMVVTAVAVASGALVARHVSPVVFVVGAAAALVGVASRRPLALAAGAAVVASALAAHSWDGLRPPPPSVVENRWVTLLTDPAPFPGGSVGADVRIGHRHAEASVFFHFQIVSNVSDTRDVRSDVFGDVFLNSLASFSAQVHDTVLNFHDDFRRIDVR